MPHFYRRLRARPLLGVSVFFFLSLGFFTFAPYILFGQVEALGEAAPFLKQTLSPDSFSKTDLLSFRNQLRAVGFITLLSLIPFGVLMLTSFIRISIVFQFLRQALGAIQSPSNQIIIGLSLILTGFIMYPVLQQAQKEALDPYLKGSFTQLPSVQSGERSEEAVLLMKAWQPLRNFLLNHTREQDLQLFLDIGHISSTADTFSFSEPVKDPVIPWYCLAPAFIMSELRTAFMMGFLLFLPFLIIDMVVSAVLMSMGMMMLPPVMVSTPFKLLLFIMIDGWRLIIQQIVSGFQAIG